MTDFNQKTHDTDVGSHGGKSRQMMEVFENQEFGSIRLLQEAGNLDPSALTLGDIQIFPEQRRVTKAGVEIYLNYGEFSILYCMARCPGRVFSREQLYNVA